MKYRRASKPIVLLLYLNPLDWASIAAPPYGLEILAASLGDQNVGVAIRNPLLFKEPGQESRRLIEAFRPSLVGLSLRNLDNLAHVWSPECEQLHGNQSHSFLPEIERVIAEIRQHTTVPVVIGGSGFSIHPTKLLERFDLKIGVVGPGEVTFRELVLASIRGQHLEEFARREIHRLPGLVVRQGASIMVNRPASAVTQERGSRTIKRMPEYDSSWTGTVPVRASDGCSARCSFCVEARNLARPFWRSPRHIANEIKEVVARDANNVWLTCGELNLPNETDALAVCRHISSARLPGLTLSSYFLPRPFSPSFYRALRDAGFTDRSICFSVVHPSDRVLKRNQVGFRRRDIDSLVDLLVKVGAKGFTVGMILGLPGETEDTLMRAISWVHDVDRIFGDSFHCFYNCGGRVYPGSGLALMVETGSDRSHLYGADDPEYLQPVVYSCPWPPRRIHDAFQDACSDCRGLISYYNRGNSMFRERPEVAIRWQRAHFFRCASNLSEAAAEFYKALAAARNPQVRQQIAKALLPCLARLNRVSEVRRLVQATAGDMFEWIEFAKPTAREYEERSLE